MKLTFFLLAMAMSFWTGMFFSSFQEEGSVEESARVTGIGGIFFKAEDPAKLAHWYKTHLGIELRAGAKPGEPQMFEWREKDNPKTIGVTVWAPFRKDTKYFAPSRAPFMINYRVNNLDVMLRQLRAAGVRVDSKVSNEANGRFGWAMDPEGNRFELWEPK
jgi:predicted enzyme related to lactoylglutathione lyase